MKIVADQNIPAIVDAFTDLGDLNLLPGRDISPELLKDCQCLITRTVTRVDEALLQDSAVEFVASATIGTDHIDLDYLARKGIGFSNAPGCNAEAAAEFVVSGIFALSKKKQFDPLKKRAGIVGFGNVGSNLFHKLDALGIECLLCDPPLALSGGCDQTLVELEQIIEQCDLISLHVPLTREGRHPTWHLFDNENLGKLRQQTLLINAARGAVIDNYALTDLLESRSDLTVFLDTWEGEPLISTSLLNRVDLATPHIAGYGVEGRLRATQMVLDAACRHFNLQSGWHMTQEFPPDQSINIDITGNALIFWQTLFHRHYDIWREHQALIDGIELPHDDFARYFDSLRKVYPDRIEYQRCLLQATSEKRYKKQLSRLGFGF